MGLVNSGLSVPECGTPTVAAESLLSPESLPFVFLIGGFAYARSTDVRSR